MKILNRLPRLSHTSTIKFGSRHVPFHRNSIVVWLSVGQRGDEELARISSPFPALLDSGNNNESFMNEYHLIHWAGMPIAACEERESIHVNGRTVPQYELDLWIHPNIPETISRDPNRAPFRLQLMKGVAVAPSRNERTSLPRVPLVGFSALLANHLDYWLDSTTGFSYLRTADWRSRLIRWLL